MHVTQRNQWRSYGDLLRVATSPAPDLPNDLLIVTSINETVALSPGDITVLLTATGEHRDTTILNDLRARMEVITGEMNGGTFWEIIDDLHEKVIGKKMTVAEAREALGMPPEIDPIKTRAHAELPDRDRLRAAIFGTKVEHDDEDRSA